MKRTLTALVGAAAVAGTLAVSVSDADCPDIAVTAGAGAPALPPASSAARSSPAPSSPRGRAAMSCTRATASRCNTRAATGPPSRSMTATAASSATPASRYRSARATKPAPATKPFRIRTMQTRRARQRRRVFVWEFALFGAVSSCRSQPHVLEHRGGRPAIDLEAVGLLIVPERGAREHAGLAVDLVLVEPELGERVLHALDLRALELRVLAPRRLERPRIADAVAQVPDEQHVEIGEIVFLDHEVVVEREERRPVGPFRLQQRRRLAELVLGSAGGRASA